MPQVAPFVAGFFGVGSTVVGAGAVAAGAYTAGAVFASTALGGALGNLLVSVAFSALANALQPKPTVPQVGINQSITFGGVTPESFIIGRYATTGQMVAPHYVHGSNGKTPNAYLTMITELGGIPGQTLEGLIIDGQEVEITASVHPEYGNALGGRYSGKAWVKFYDGTQTGADQYLIAKYGAYPYRPWSSKMIGTGVCYAIVTCLFDRNIFTGFPRITYVCGGIPLYDPRKDSSVGGSGSHRWSDRSTWEQTDNPAVMAYNIARGITLPDGSVWGGEYTAAGLPFDNWVAAMNACDATVTNADASTEPAYRAGYEVSVDQKPSDVIRSLMDGCAGQVAPMGDTLKIRVGGPGLPAYFLTDDDIIVSESQDLQPFPGLSATHNAVTAKYPEPASLWQAHDAPPRYNAAWEAEDQDRRLVADLEFPAVPYGNQVQRLMAAYIQDARRFRQHTITLPPDAAEIEPLDVISWTSEANGYSSKSFDVTQAVDAQQTVLQRLMIREVDPTDYSWDAATMQLPNPVPVLGAANDVLQIAPGVSVSDEVRTVAQQPVGVLIVEVSWADTTDTAEVQYRRNGETQWISMGVSAAGRFEVVGIERGGYDVRVRATNLSVQSEWVTVYNWSAELSGLQPDDVADFSIAIVSGTAHLSWSPVATAGLSHYVIRWSPKTIDATYANSVTLIPKVARPGTSATVPAQTGTYFIRAVDKFGNQSINSSSITTTVAGIEGLNAIGSISEAPTFDGATVLFDEVPGNFDAASGNFDDAGGVQWETMISGSGLVITDHSAPTTAIYESREVFDLGDVYTSRLSIDLDVIRLDEGSGTFDDAPGLFSDRDGLFDGDTDRNDIEVVVEVSTSDDLVSWSGWRSVTVGDFTARAFKLRAKLITLSPNVTPLVTALSLIIDMPDRVISGSDIDSGTLTKTVSFSPALLGLSGLGISAQGLQTGDYYQITNKSPAGFDITFRDAAGSIIARTFDYVARGYGRAV